MENWLIDVDSFGADCPENWEEIADFLNEIIRKEIREDMDYRDKDYVSEKVWEAYCNGDLKDAPEAIWDDSE